VCDTSTSTRLYAAVDTGIVFDRASLVAGANTTMDPSDGAAPHTAGAFATGKVLRILGSGRVEASASYSRSTYIDMLGGSIGPGFGFFTDALDMSVYYRHTLLRYRSFPTALVQHAVGGTMVLLPASAFVFTFQGEALGGDDTPALVMFGTVSWRPGLR